MDPQNLFKSLVHKSDTHQTRLDISDSIESSKYKYEISLTRNL